jgi:sodium transport system permease protein
MSKSIRPSIVGSIFRRELLDILRDRRTIFMMIIFPVLLYPLIGIVVSQLAIAFQEKPRQVVVVNAQALPSEPALLSPDKTRFDVKLYGRPDDANRLQIQLADKNSPWMDTEKCGMMLREGLADVVVIVPDDLPKSIEEGKAGNLEIIYNSSDDRGQLAYGRVRDIVARWNELVLAKRLKADAKSADYANPIREKVRDVATARESSGQLWSRMLPFLLVLMSLTGAFYPAIDLCAGEKERGTMETLLISPARRTEIVAAKFLTILTSSLVTAAMNLISLALTSWQLLGQLGKSAGGAGGGNPALASLSLPSPGVMILAFFILIPIAAFLSAICLALAVMARSTKEGQYYLTPVLMLAFPLTYMTLVPGVELSPVYSLIPLTGTCLLLKTVLAGRIDQALPYALPVLLPTMAYAWMALRWAVSQFESESVLFREAERFDLKSWFLWNIRNKTNRPTADQAAMCFVLMLVSGWFAGPLINQIFSTDGQISTVSLIVTQFVVIGLPPILLALLLSKNPRQVLRLVPSVDKRYLILGLLFPMALHPLITELYAVVEFYLPMSDTIKKLFGGVVRDDALLMSILAVAVLPGLCEELAFRGWIFSGLRTNNKPWATIIISSVLFGVMHVLMSAYQQFFHSTVLGLVLGLLALRSGSLWPSVIMHITNNAMAVTFGFWGKNSPSTAGWLFSDPESLRYRWPLVVISIPAIIALFIWCYRMPAVALETDDTELEVAE